MCGLVGFLGGAALDGPAGEALLHAMSASLRHRGPDGAGAWYDPQQRIGLGHRRLSIIDLSPAGEQPMHSGGGRYVLAFNGEIYNHLELRRELDALGAPAWRGHSDTETLLAAIETWGPQAALCKAVGMFAFALWDRQDRTLTLARDRLGEKPLYYGWHGGVLFFGSELKALRVHPGFPREIDRNSIALLLRYGAIPAPHSIHPGIHKLAPGTLLTVSPGGQVQQTAYWSALASVRAGAGRLFEGDTDSALQQLDACLRRAVGGQLLSDVPLGAFLSGGIDSSLIVALMQAQSARPVQTFTMGFEEAGYNEAGHARQVAAHLGTEHTEMMVSARQAIDVIPTLPAVYDEPFADSSQIPTLLLSQLVRRKVTVALTGDGGDEVFGGYNRYTTLDRLWSAARPVPRFLRAGVALGLKNLPPALWSTLLPGVPQASEKVNKIAGVLRARDPQSAYLCLVSQWSRPDEVVLGAAEPATAATDPSSWPDLAHPVDRIMYLDAVSYLPDDILVKVDRAAMSASLETRAPFLDHRVFEFAWQLPLAMKIRGVHGKWILRKLLESYLPAPLMDRPKQGFAVPLGAWLRGPLRDWAEELLSEQRLKREGYFRPAPIRQAWAQHLQGRGDSQHPLWTVLMFQSWLESQRA